ncbi:MAG: DNA-processing protein DprA [Pseudomonadota bacterium]
MARRPDTASTDDAAEPAPRPPPLPTAQLSDDERIACLRLLRTPGVGAVTFQEIINRFGGAGAAIRALPELAERRGGRSLSIASVRRAEDELEAATRARATLIFTIEPGYPQRLAFVKAPPPCLYVRGNLDLLNAPSIAIVGSRTPSANGRVITRDIARGLGLGDYVVVSGLARGIDAEAHKASLATGTIGVIAGGIDTLYPPEHAELQEAIADRGALVAEMPPGFKARGQDFPRRNRIISGISLGVVVIEAKRRSGSLITANLAGEQGREVMAVPGHPLDPRAYGTNWLIQNGNKLVTSANDVIELIQPIDESRSPGRGAPANYQQNETATNEAQSAARASQFDDAPSAEPASRHASRAAPSPHLDAESASLILDAVGAAPTRIDDIARETAFSVAEVRALLTDLALTGEISHIEGDQVVRAPPSTHC